jgi:hypothetical protein
MVSDDFRSRYAGSAISSIVAPRLKINRSCALEYAPIKGNRNRAPTNLVLPHRLCEEGLFSADQFQPWHRKPIPDRARSWSRGARSREGSLDAIVSRSRRGRLLIRLACVLLIGFVTADDASGNRADFPVPCQMARHATNDSALDASFRFTGGGSDCYGQDGGAKDQRLHGGSPKNWSLAISGVTVIGSVNDRHAEKWDA